MLNVTAAFSRTLKSLIFQTADKVMVGYQNCCLSLLQDLGDDEQGTCLFCYDLIIIPGGKIGFFWCRFVSFFSIFNIRVLKLLTFL